MKVRVYFYLVSLSMKCLPFAKTFTAISDRTLKFQNLIEFVKYIVYKSNVTQNQVIAFNDSICITAMSHNSKAYTNLVPCTHCETTQVT